MYTQLLRFVNIMPHLIGKGITFKGLFYLVGIKADGCT